MQKRIKIELLSPAGDFESLNAAIKAGCDSVYFGIDHLNMRVLNTKNFTLEDMKKVAEICHENKVKCCLTLNTIVFDHDFKKMNEILREAKKSNVNAVICSDLAVIQEAYTLGVEVHISTQMSVSNYEAAKFASNFSDRIVLARELTLPQIKCIKTKIIEENLKGPHGRLLEIECFAHGAMCIAVSGRCFMSLFEFNSSANRGACLQSCRRSYKVIDMEENKEMILEDNHVMSPEDLCTIEFVDLLINNGIDVLKIEGRGRSPDYVYTTTKCYRRAIDAVINGQYNQELKDELKTELSKVYNRGFSNGFYMGVPINAWNKAYCSKAVERKKQIGKVLNYFSNIQVAEIEIEKSDIKDGEDIGFSGDTTGWMKQKLEGIIIDGKKSDNAKKGQIFTMKIKEKVRKNDKVFKFIKIEDKPIQEVSPLR